MINTHSILAYTIWISVRDVQVHYSNSLSCIQRCVKSILYMLYESSTSNILPNYAYKHQEVLKKFMIKTETCALPIHTFQLVYLHTGWVRVICTQRKWCIILPALLYSRTSRPSTYNAVLRSGLRIVLHEHSLHTKSIIEDKIYSTIDLSMSLQFTCYFIRSSVDRYGTNNVVRKLSALTKKVEVIYKYFVTQFQYHKPTVLVPNTLI
jgi:hypothetical protein